MTTTHMTPDEAKVLLACLWLQVVRLELVAEVLGYEHDEDGSKRLASLLADMYEKDWINCSDEIKGHDQKPIYMLSIRPAGLEALGGLDAQMGGIVNFRETLRGILDAGWNMLINQQSARIN